MHSPHRVPSSAGLGHAAVKYFSLSAGVILLVTGVAKIVSIFGVARVLQAKVPLGDITYGHLLFVVGVVELLVACLCFYPKARNLSVICVATLATSFLLYRLGLWSIGWHGFCGCMGNLTGALGLSTETAGQIMKFLLAYLLLGSYAALAWQWSQKHPSKSPPPPQSAPTPSHRPNIVAQ